MDWKQKKRAHILFEQYPKLGEAYSLAHSLRTFYAKNSIKDAAQLNLARWYNKVAEADFKSFNVIAANIMSIMRILSISFLSA